MQQKLPVSPAIAQGAHWALLEQLDGHTPVEVVVHTPLEQVCPAAHARPHEPQFAVDARSDASQPFAATPSQSPKPGEQTSAQPPPTQAAGALVRIGHATL